MEFHKKLQQLRKEKGLTQEELAQVLFVSRTAISKWESGRGYPSIDSLRMIAKFFDVFILRLATDFDLISKQEKLKILQTIELLQKRRDKDSNNEEIDKERAKYLILNCFDAVLVKDYNPFITSIKDTKIVSF